MLGATPAAKAGSQSRVAWALFPGGTQALGSFQALPPRHTLVLPLAVRAQNPYTHDHFVSAVAFTFVQYTFTEHTPVRPAPGAELLSVPGSQHRQGQTERRAGRGQP